MNKYKKINIPVMTSILVFPCTVCEDNTHVTLEYGMTKGVYTYQIQCGGCNARGPIRAMAENAVADWNLLHGRDVK